MDLFCRKCGYINSFCTCVCQCKKCPVPCIHQKFIDRGCIPHIGDVKRSMLFRSFKSVENMKRPCLTVNTDIVSGNSLIEIVIHKERRGTLTGRLNNGID